MMLAPPMMCTCLSPAASAARAAAAATPVGDERERRRALDDLLLRPVRDDEDRHLAQPVRAPAAGVLVDPAAGITAPHVANPLPRPAPTDPAGHRTDRHAAHRPTQRPEYRDQAGDAAPGAGHKPAHRAGDRAQPAPAELPHPVRPVPARVAARAGRVPGAA